MTTSRELDVLALPAHRPAGTDVTFQGRRARTDRWFIPVQGLVAPVAGLSTPAGVLIDATPTTRGASMI